jgi:DNA polymerase-3 subunit gamma/tau
MSYLVLARKWRPQTFADIVGQEHVTRTLQNAIRSGRIAHAFLFTGVRGVGKTTAARVLAKALNCAEGPTPEPCNVCTPCLEITRGQSVDVIEIDGASNTSVDDVRVIIENVRYQPASCRFKIYIIDEVHMLSTSAFNALLKTLEEPPPHVKFIFATTDPHKVPATVQSRCQRYDFRRIPLRKVVERLAEIARAEGIEISERALFAVAREAEGSMRDAQSLLDQLIAYGDKHIEDGHVYAALGVADRRAVVELADALLNKDCTRGLALLDELYGAGQDLRRLLRELLECLHDVELVQIGVTEPVLERWGADELDALRQLGTRTSPLEVDRMFRGLLPLDNELARVPFPKLVLEMALIRLATQEPVLPLGDLLEELHRLERLLAPGAAKGTETRPQPRPLPENTHARSTRSSQKVAAPAVEVVHADPVEESPPPSLASSSGASSPSWQDFVAFVRKHKPVLATHLEFCSRAEVAADCLTLVMPRGLHLDYLEQPRSRAQLASLARQFFHSNLQLQFVQDTGSSTDSPAEKQRKERQKVVDHPLVRAAVEILGAQIQEVRPRNRTPGKEDSV